MVTDVRSRLVRDLPIPGAGCGDIRMRSDGCQFLIEYEYRSDEDGRDLIGAICFSEVTGYRFRDEMHSKGFVEGSYDALVEIINSEWCRELLDAEPNGTWGSVENKKHFAVLFSSNGYLEVVADSFEELPPREGVLDS